MHVEILDDCCFPWHDLSPKASVVPVAGELDTWFWTWARSRISPEDGARPEVGLFFINAHGSFTTGACRQDLQGVEILKHIRLTPALGTVRSWHAVVYSFEPLPDILSRKPGALILMSPGVTLLKLPDALDLQNALRNAYPGREWSSTSVMAMLADLAKNNPAAPTDRSFRPFVAADYRPPDSAHRLSNWWGIYEMFLTVLEADHPEFTMPEKLPAGVRDFVLRLETKKAYWLERSAASSKEARNRLRKTLAGQRSKLIRAASGKTIVYIDDEAANGWTTILQGLLSGNGPQTSTVITMDKSSLGLRSEDRLHDHAKYSAKIRALVEGINAKEPDLVILDLRLLGQSEAFTEPGEASGMDLAREIRQQDPYLPILLFTASNKAETLFISRSLEIDDFWMKPGLGEHRGSRLREDNLLVLVTKLTNLLGPNYSWLQRAAHALRQKLDGPEPLWWMQPQIGWPGPGSQRIDTQTTDQDVRRRVSARLDTLLYTTRTLFRLGQMFAGGANRDSTENGTVYRPPESLARTIGDAIINQIGQLIEQVHDLSRRDPFGCYSSNGILGGYFVEPTFIFRRLDWWAYRLYAFRNEASHHTQDDGATDNDVKAAITDLIAWILVERVEIKSIDQDLAERVARAMAATPEVRSRRTKRLEIFPILRLHPQDPLTMSLSNGEVQLDRPDNKYATDSRFRDQLAMRPEFEPLIERSKTLLRGTQTA